MLRDPFVYNFSVNAIRRGLKEFHNIKNFAHTYTKEVVMRKFNSGEIAPETATYCVIDSEGNVLKCVDVNKGDRLPPTESSHYHYELSK